MDIETNHKDILAVILQKIYSDKYNSDLLSSILQAGEWVSLNKNDKLFEEGSPSDSFYFLVKGSLKAFKNTNNQLEYIGGIREGELIGEMGLISGEARSASIYSNRKSVLFKIFKDDFELSCILFFRKT